MIVTNRGRRKRPAKPAQSAEIQAPRIVQVTPKKGQAWRLKPLEPDPEADARVEEFFSRIPNNAPERALRCRAAVASTLIAGLERARDGALALDQEVDWMPIRVRRRANGAAGVGDFGSPS